MDLVTKDILYRILLYVDNLTNININKDINNILKEIYSEKIFWMEKLPFIVNIYDILTINGNWIYYHYRKHNIDLPIQTQKVRDLRMGQYVIINGSPCKLVNIDQSRD
jgi:hypothetical protein